MITQSYFLWYQKIFDTTEKRKSSSDPNNTVAPLVLKLVSEPNVIRKQIQKILYSSSMLDAKHFFFFFLTYNLFPNFMLNVYDCIVYSRLYLGFISYENSPHDISIT